VFKLTGLVTVILSNLVLSPPDNKPAKLVVANGNVTSAPVDETTSKLLVVLLAIERSVGVEPALIVLGSHSLVVLFQEYTCPSVGAVAEISLP
jgi:hypothetical protein